MKTKAWILTTGSGSAFFFSVGKKSQDIDPPAINGDVLGTPHLLDPPGEGGISGE